MTFGYCTIIMCVLSMTDMTNMFLTLIKYADDMVLVGRLKDEHSISEYFFKSML